MRRRCGYGLLYEISKWNTKKAPEESYFMDCIARMRDTFDQEEPTVRGGMGGALMGIGKRSKKLNSGALKLAKKVGPIRFDDDDKCEPFDVAKHLTSDHVKKKLGI